MNIAKVKKTCLKSEYPDMEDISSELDGSGEKYYIETINWKSYEYKPDVTFSIAYSGNEIFLKYYITENQFKAEKTESNQMVCEDSCVEFFVSPEDDGVYYNFEFNGIGTCQLGAGTSRGSRITANSETISKIRRLSSVGNKPVKEIKGKLEWTLTIAIPFEVFFRHEVKELKGRTFRANFYKCGDKLTVPHYVTWNPVYTEKPDFHQQDYFGFIKFI